MIKIKNELLNDTDFITRYLADIGGKIAKKFKRENDCLILPLNKLFTMQRIPISRELIDRILIDPFTHHPFKEARAARFLDEYQAIKTFLLHGKEYYDLLKEMKYYKEVVEQGSFRDTEDGYLYSVRKKVLNDFSSVIRLPIPEGAISDESIYFNFYSQIDSEFSAVNKIIDQFFNYTRDH